MVTGFVAEVASARRNQIYEVVGQVLRTALPEIW
jgi:hypothetical protein